MNSLRKNTEQTGLKYSETREAVIQSEGKHSLQDYALTVTLLEHMSDAIFLLNSQGQIEFANSASLNMLDYPMDSIRGHSISDFIVEIEDDYLLGRTVLGVTEWIKHLPFDDLEAIMQGKERLIPVIVSCHPITDDTEKATYFLFSAKDMSRHREAEFELQSDQILSIYRNRMKTVSSLSASLIHALTQPLQALQLQAELFQQNYSHLLQANDNGIRRLSEIMELIRKINAILEGIREFAQWSLDEQILQVNLSDIFKRATSLLTYEIDYYKIELREKIDPGFPQIHVYPILLTEAIFNLIKNSIEAHQGWDSQGSVKKINLLGKVTPHHWLEIVVEDNAPAIPKDYRTKIFKPYFTTKTSGKHVGLGLTVSQKIFEILGGDLTYYSSGSHHNAFQGRLPVSDMDERHTLQNLIELHHHQ